MAGDALIFDAESGGARADGQSLRAPLEQQGGAILGSAQGGGGATTTGAGLGVEHAVRTAEKRTAETAVNIFIVPWKSYLKCYWWRR